MARDEGAGNDISHRFVEPFVRFVTVTASMSPCAAECCGYMVTHYPYLDGTTPSYLIIDYYDRGESMNRSGTRYSTVLQGTVLIPRYIIL